MACLLQLTTVSVFGLDSHSKYSYLLTDQKNDLCLQMEFSLEEGFTIGWRCWWCDFGVSWGFPRTWWDSERMISLISYCIFTPFNHYKEFLGTGWLKRIKRFWLGKGILNSVWVPTTSSSLWKKIFALLRCHEAIYGFNGVWGERIIWLG